jgi:hypothetical protein
LAPERGRLPPRPAPCSGAPHPHTPRVASSPSSSSAPSSPVSGAPSPSRTACLANDNEEDIA